MNAPCVLGAGTDVLLLLNLHSIIFSVVIAIDEKLGSV
jgi:hypothetical protein